MTRRNLALTALLWLYLPWAHAWRLRLRTLPACPNGTMPGRIHSPGRVRQRQPERCFIAIIAPSATSRMPMATASGHRCAPRWSAAPPMGIWSGSSAREICAMECRRGRAFRRRSGGRLWLTCGAFLKAYAGPSLRVRSAPARFRVRSGQNLAQYPRLFTGRRSRKVDTNPLNDASYTCQ